jgi:hypothetical protein
MSLNDDCSICHPCFFESIRSLLSNGYLRHLRSLWNFSESTQKLSKKVLLLGLGRYPEFSEWSWTPRRGPGMIRSSSSFDVARLDLWNSSSCGARSRVPQTAKFHLVQLCLLTYSLHHPWSCLRLWRPGQESKTPSSCCVSNSRWSRLQQNHWGRDFSQQPSTYASTFVCLVGEHDSWSGNRMTTCASRAKRTSSGS